VEFLKNLLASDQMYLYVSPCTENSHIRVYLKV